MTSFISGWYAITPSRTIKKNKPFSIKRFNLPLVLWRDEKNTLQCMLDRCPHRGAKLSLGKIKKNCIECPYHGFLYAPDGHCKFAPEFNKPLPNFNVKTFAVKEFMNMVWVYYGDKPTPFEYRVLSSIDQAFSNAYAETSQVWSSHITYCIENQLDYAHLPTVHHNTIGRSFKYPEHPRMEMDETHIAMHLKEDDTPTAEFFFPNCWVLNISKKMRLLVYFAPIDEQKTRLYLRSYNKLLTLKITRGLLSALFSKINLIILNQDQRVVSSQGKSPSYLAAQDVLMKNDTAIKYFRAHWANNINLQSNIEQSNIEQ